MHAHEAAQVKQKGCYIQQTVGVYLFIYFNVFLFLHADLTAVPNLPMRSWNRAHTIAPLWPKPTVLLSLKVI